VGRASHEVQSGQNGRTHAAFAAEESFGSEGDFDPDVQDERAMLALAVSGKSLCDAIEHLILSAWSRAGIDGRQAGA
jgi:hypothetical protein